MEVKRSLVRSEFLDVKSRYTVLELEGYGIASICVPHV
jgi:hypothetical protein